MKLRALLLLAAFVTTARGRTLTDGALRRIDFEQKPGTVVTLGLRFRDESGASVRLGDYFGSRPVILVLGYYRCPMLCTAVLNGLMGGFQDLALDAHKDFEVVNVSIDPDDTPELAAAKKRTCVVRRGALAAEGWHFLTGTEPAISRLAEEVGFHYARDPVTGQYAHPAGLVVLTPAGRVSSYLAGVNFTGVDLRKAIGLAAASQVSSPVRQFFLLCFHYNPLTGKYSGLIMAVTRALAGAVLLSLIALIVHAARKGNPL